MASLELQEISEEKSILLKRRMLLQKQYKYYNEFNFSENLGVAISILIKEAEGIDCVCKKLVCEVPEHEELVQRHFLGKDQMVRKRFSKKSYPFVVIIKKEFVSNFDDLTFETFDEMKQKLEDLSLFFTTYPGILDLEMFELVFPYLKHFFQILNEWRFQTGRVTLDECIIQEAMNTVLNGLNIKEGRMH